MSSEQFVKWINYCLLALVAAVPLIYLPTSMFPFNIVKMVVFQVLTEIAFALWLALAIFNKKYRPKPTPLLIALIAFIIVLSLSSLFGVDLRASLWSDEQRALGLITLIHLIGLFALAASLREEIRWKNIWLASFLTASIISLIGVSQKFIAVPKTFSPWIYIFYQSTHATLDRITSTFGNSAFLAGYLLFNLFIGLWLIRSNTKPWIIWLGTIIIFIGIVFAQTLGVFLGLAVSFVYSLIYLLFARKEVLFKNIKNIRYAYAAVLTAFIVFGLAFFITKDASLWQRIPGLARVSQTSLSSPSVRDRLLVWDIALVAFKEKPWLGWGPENFRIAYDKHYNPGILSVSINGTNWDKPHNVILEYLTVSGILGLVAYLGVWLAIFYELFRLQQKKNNEAMPLIIGAGLVAYFGQNLFIFDTIGTYLMFFLLASFVDSEYQTAPLKANEAHLSSSEVSSARYFKIVFLITILIALIPIYYNYEMLNAASAEYWGANYLLNKLPEASVLYFSQAMATPTPYLDDIVKNFADTVRGAVGQGIQYQNTDKLQANIVVALRGVINRHPRNFYNYVTLAEFEEKFYQYDPSYLNDAQSLLLKALSLSPNRQQVYYTLAKDEVLKNDKKSAYDIFERLVSLNPDVAQPHLYFGLLAYGLGDVKTGHEEIAKAKALGGGPQTPEEYVVLGNYVGDYEHDYKQAIKFYQSALDALPFIGSPQTKSNILLKLGVAYYFDRDYDKARQTFLELEQEVDLKSLPIYPQLKPVLQELHIPN